MDVLEVALDEAALVGRGGAGGVVDSIDHLGGQPYAVRGGQAQRRALIERQRAVRGHRAPHVADGLQQEGAAGPEMRLRVTGRHLDHRLIPQERLHGARRLGAGRLVERAQARARHAERHRGVAGGERERARDAVQRAVVQQRRGRRQHGALGRDEDVVHREVVGAGAAHATHLPGVEDLGLGDRHEEVARLRLAPLEPGRAVVEDLGVGGDPGRVTAAGAEALAARHAIPAGHHDGGRGGGRRVGDDGARRVDPDRPGDVARHARRVRRVDRALVDAPAGAGVGLAQLLDHLDVGRQVELGAADRARHREMEHPGVGQRLEQRPRQLALGLGLVGAGLDLGRELPRGLERGGRHRARSATG